MNKSKRLTALLLAALLTLAFTSCASSDGGASSGGAENTTASSGDTQTSATETETAKLAPSLPELDLGGETYMVLAKMEGDEKGRWTAHDVYVAEQNGEVVNDAVYERNSIIEDKYNVKIAQQLMNMGGQYTYCNDTFIYKLSAKNQ